MALHYAPKAAPRSSKPKPTPNAERSTPAPPPRKPGKEAISIRLDADVLASYRSLGKGWQRVINDDLRNARGI